MPKKPSEGQKKSDKSSISTSNSYSNASIISEMHMQKNTNQYIQRKMQNFESITKKIQYPEKKLAFQNQTNTLQTSS